ncbi:hypothetical protein M501DRAFT_1004926 [Patellaria atrata CBS 101060]|uniref:Cytochrome b-c1 complex subunit 8 n=1 Tax=Patellaria atrata CBS 101060 TaxID=1346257 RepID=A0A9P4VM09_9PEZI|nr:hypothetical protein M501DRAFT_1004926 [Patellaria atrata CBS 101060]
MGGGGGGKVPGVYMGWWGNLGSPPQKGVTTYGLAQNRQRPLAGTLHAAFFNVGRRTAGQILYWAPPMVAAYAIMSWAIERNDYLNSKAGHQEFAEEAE